MTTHNSTTAHSLYIFARFHAQEGRDAELGSLLSRQTAHARTEPGCAYIAAYRSTRDSRLFFLHSVWNDEAAFDAHAALSNTEQFEQRVQPILTHDLVVTRTRLFYESSQPAESAV